MATLLASTADLASGIAFSSPSMCVSLATAQLRRAEVDLIFRCFTRARCSSTFQATEAGAHRGRELRRQQGWGAGRAREGVKDGGGPQWPC